MKFEFPIESNRLFLSLVIIWGRLLGDRLLYEH